MKGDERARKRGRQEGIKDARQWNEPMQGVCEEGRKDITQVG